MHTVRICLCFGLAVLLLPSVTGARTDFSKLDPDSPQVQQAAEEAVQKLGPDRGAVKIERNEIDILGISRGMVGEGMAMGGRVEDVEKALKDLGAEVTEKEIRMDLPSDILFDFDKADIRPDAREALSKVAIVIRAHSGKVVLIEGHTDSKGSEDYNMELSLRRAESVKQWLKEKENLQKTPFQTKGWGESRPKATNETEAGRQKNRRVEITLKK
jgi:outer membrane protein OmpA-like peptidoglycan-associated protein